MDTRITQFPAQQKSMSEKTDAWHEECIEAGLTIATGDTSKIRKSKANKKINFDLANGIMDESDINLAFNPMGIKGIKFPAKIQNYPIEISKFNVLKGEESKRRFDWRIRSVNEDAISAKESEMREQLYGLIVSELNNPDYSDEQAERRMRQLQRYQEYEHQDLSELTATRVLSYFWHTQRMKDIFSDAFWDVLIGAEELYSVDIIHGNPEVTKKNILNVSTLGMGESHRIEDSDIIIDDGFYPIGKVIDYFWDVFTADETKTIEEGWRNQTNRSHIVIAGPIDVKEKSIDYSNSQLITVSGYDTWTYGGTYDEDGNIRVARVVWRSRKKVGEVTFPDPNTGEERKTFVDENFPIREDLGMTVKWFWINEWRQGYKIGHDIYKRMEVLPRIGSSMTNPSISMSPYCGTVFNINSSEGVSLMDRVKPYKYLYNIFMRRTELASARNKGVLAELDLAEVPDGWDEELQMMYAEMTGYIIKDSFKEGKKGAAMGKLVSTIKQKNSAVMNLNSSDAITANLELARYVKNELAEISGISPQREGQIDNRETFGGVERSVTQSSHITEEWFRLHDNTKLRVLDLVLETAKYAWREFSDKNAKKLQYVDDGLITHMFKIDGRVFHESEYGLYVSDSQNDQELIRTIKSLAHAGMQNDKVTFGDLISIYRDPSISSMAKKLEHSEKKQEEREDMVRREALKSQEKQAETLMQIEQMKLDQQANIEKNKVLGKITEVKMKIQGDLMTAGMDQGKIDEISAKGDQEIEKLKLQIKQQDKELTENKRQFDKQLTQDNQLAIKGFASSEKIARKRQSAKT